MKPLKNNFKRGDKNIPHGWLNTIANFWNDLQVQNGALTRRSDGRFTTIRCSDGDSGDVVDADGYSATNGTCGRKTIDTRKDVQPHLGEHELFAVETVAANVNAMPYFASGAFGTWVGTGEYEGTTFGSIRTGTLAWCVPDAENGTLQHSIDINGTLLQIQGFHSTTDDQAAYAEVVDGTRTVEWRVPVRVSDGTYSGAGTNVAFVTGAQLTNPPGGDYVSVVLNLGTHQIADGTHCVHLASPQTTIAAYGTIGYGTQGSTGTGYNAHDLLRWDGGAYFQDAYGATCDDHDPRHWVKGSAEAQNYGTAIGDSVKVKVIDLDGLTLGRGSGTSFAATLDWGARNLSGGDWNVTGTNDFRVGGDGTFYGNVRTDGGYYLGSNQVVGVRGTIGAYTADTQGTAYVGMDNAQEGPVYAQSADLNTLRTAYETLRTAHDALRGALVTHGLVQA